MQAVITQTSRIQKGRIFWKQLQKEETGRWETKKNSQKFSFCTEAQGFMVSRYLANKKEEKGKKKEKEKKNCSYLMKSQRLWKAYNEWVSPRGNLKGPIQLE